MNMGLCSKKSIYHKSLSFLSGFCLFVSLVSVSILITFNMNFVYKVAYDHLPIKNTDSMEKAVVFQNYDYIIDYTTNFREVNFNMPDFPSSENGSVHFQDVKNVYNIIFVLFIVTSILALLFHLIDRFLKFNKDFLFVKISSKFMMFFLVVFVLPLGLLFNFSFDWMHEIIFSNDYWLLNSGTDPIINFLPQEYFLLCFIIIIGLMTFNIFLLKLIYKHFGKERIK